jgi:hypothetical protein
LKFCLDEDLAPAAAAALRRRGIDAISAHDAGNRGLTDAAQLAFAAREGRCLVTGNVRHFVLLAQEAIRDDRRHAGIVLCSPRLAHGSPGRLAAALERLARDRPGGLGAYDGIYL